MLLTSPHSRKHSPGSLRFAISPTRSSNTPRFHAVILSCDYILRDVLLHSGLVEKLHNSLSSMVHLTIDMWTSSEQKMTYQAIVADFVDAETREFAEALFLREFKGSHSGESKLYVISRATAKRLGTAYGQSKISPLPSHYLLDGKKSVPHTG